MYCIKIKKFDYSVENWQKIDKIIEIKEIQF